jgi:hypothetical protein
LEVHCGIIQERRRGETIWGIRRRG